MIKGFCLKKLKAIVDGKVTNHCFKVRCEHLKLQIKKKYYIKKRDRRWKNSFKTNYG